MNKNIARLLIVVLCMGLLLSLAACGGPDGTYYKYKNGEYDKTSYYILKDGKWESDEGTSGTYTVDEEGRIYLYTSVAGKEIDYAKGTVADGKLELTVSSLLGISSVYYMEGKAPKE